MKPVKPVKMAATNLHSYLISEGKKKKKRDLVFFLSLSDRHNFESSGDSGMQWNCVNGERSEEHSTSLLLPGPHTTDKSTSAGTECVNLRCDLNNDPRQHDKYLL